MCGKETGSLVKAKIEGTELAVCENCGSFGQVLKKIETKPVIEKKYEEPAPIVKREIVETIVPDYPKIVRKIREDLGLNHEKFAAKISEKVSIVHKMETGHYTPDLKLAHKLERMFGVHLIEETADVQGPVAASANKEGSVMTLGDLIKKKTKQ
jgi:putative transcription factor